MAIRGVALTVTYTAWDTLNGTVKTGDVANHTIKIVKDGTEATATNSPTEIDSTNLKGEYKITLTSAEMTCDFITIGGVSSTSGIIIVPVKITTEHALLKGNATHDLRQMMIMTWEMLMSGKISGLPSSPATLRNFEDTADRATIDFDANDNRTTFTEITPVP